ncbi:hypothetical protein PHYBLDRAFT_150882 [Phycomyces blakesleeanus NRRL 1555(-)]|uniref:Uncharacterized protein n=1 Tax=Phycomyces blakesleeanus (strain ATCC 8743b / DSM 1359 / FGSC 10004 / NBRC 33097 / NRRL 1555) TaxID=763407 RepID=A0A162N2C5_PHYB8|nr:hypothetical protein PHYBLDRAFT_150882 [Phycomyces blakesleeanus NRRL 1555(-)]OAD67788.1 hypothetical protein PHYBLDRAFT_150882 [Phycomyces blakesleeanus NRRL 1555(-)]|eukprot:XP_018285828.1 hypothetical protein PHYBLDRAFT_150882 [Phycomyces blakesleeanus NRRL 1555(-)]
MSGFDLMTKTVFKYTICIKRDVIYLPGYHQSNCSSEKHIPPHLSMTIDMLGEADEAFVNHAHSLMLTLNVYWFKLFEGRTYTGGALYLLINNFPKEDQMRPENIILVDVMPRPKETTKFPNGTTVYTAIMCVASNILAASNAVGFRGHPITNDCHKFKRYFSAIIGSKSDVERGDLEKQSGMQFSELHRLHDSFEMVLYFSAAVIARVQCFVDGIIVPHECAVLFEKVPSGSSYMKAGEWRSWCLVHLLVVLKESMSKSDCNNWTTLVKTYRKLRDTYATYSNIGDARQLLGIASNMHLHLHLRESMLDFSPVYAFWMYSLERYNDKLKKNFKTNCRNGLECIDNGQSPSLPFNLPMFQQVVNSQWYNLIGSKALPPTTLPLKSQPLNTMSIQLGECAGKHSHSEDEEYLVA